MLSSLDALAGKISPGSEKNSPSQQVQTKQQIEQQQSGTTTNQLQQLHFPVHKEDEQQYRYNGNHYNGLDSNSNKLCQINHNSIHPYQKHLPSQNSSQQVIPPTQQQQLQSYSQRQQQLQQQQHELFQQQMLYHQKTLLLQSQQTLKESDSQQDSPSCLKEK